MSSGGLKVLFVCLGNTCRSPMAEAVFKYYLEKNDLLADWEIDSAAIEDWHKGKPPNFKTLQIMEKYKVPINHFAKQIKEDDFMKYDIIFGMDYYNMMELEERAPRNCTAKLYPFGAFDPKKKLQIRDPYCDIGLEGFEECYRQCVRCTKGFLKQYYNGKDIV